ncbi:probable N-acetyltransferase camello [Pseudophryne corroboree]|uniref:probable N-acetyltransferase camello n=1 Tax=Pseudophryne corroboree TaxID=495146 RepID=UPI003081A867
MADISIRTYKSGDYEAVRALFAEGMLSYVPSTIVHLLKRPLVYIPMSVSLITLHMAFRSYLLSLLGVASLLAAGFLLLKTMFRMYINKCHRGDLLNIEESYMMGQDSCFWVAESNGRVIGMVGVQPVPGSRHAVLLRRLSVTKSQRHRGTARKLCMTVIDFARQRGYKQVTLDASTLLHAGHRLYQRLGFQITKVKQNLAGKFVNSVIIYYTYHIQ